MANKITSLDDYEIEIHCFIAALSHLLMDKEGIVVELLYDGSYTKFLVWKETNEGVLRVIPYFGNTEPGKKVYFAEAYQDSAMQHD